MQHQLLDLYYPYYTVAGSGNRPMPELRSNGIADQSDDGVVVRTGTHTGFIKVRVEVLGQEPQLHCDGWDEVAEVSFVAPEGHVYISSFADEYLEHEPSVTPGPQRLRVHVRGRDAGHDADTVMEGEEIPEEHLLQIWPAPFAAANLLKVGDEVGSALRADSSRDA